MAVDTLLALLTDAGWSALAAFGFALAFNAPRRTLIGCALAGATGHAVRTALMAGGLPLEFATLAGASSVGALAWLFARWQRTPALIYAICGSIPLVPGVFAFRAMLALINIAAADPGSAGPFLEEAAIAFTRTGITLAAIAIGITAPTLLFGRRKPVV
ncbi:MAG: threonine/serine exporter family protein [Anaerolinea sp.]|nr:threonine/serine exporter family protein [Anaerolinea sp.]